jgi:hypothetical protein
MEETEGEFNTEMMWFGLMRSGCPRVILYKRKRMGRRRGISNDI